jgi:hypothetical protein
MSMLYRWGLEELDTLRVPEEKWRLDLILAHEPSKKHKSSLESLDACWQEDIRRAGALKRLPEHLYPGGDLCNPLKLASDKVRRLGGLYARPPSSIFRVYT